MDMHSPIRGHPWTCIHIHRFMHPSMHPSHDASIHPSAHPPIHLRACTHPPIPVSIHPPMNMYNVPSAHSRALKIKSFIHVYYLLSICLWYLPLHIALSIHHDAGPSTVIHPHIHLSIRRYLPIYILNIYRAYNLSYEPTDPYTHKLTAFSHQLIHIVLSTLPSTHPPAHLSISTNGWAS